jgi:membrane protein YdbS with pleckstrin-like domain
MGKSSVPSARSLKDRMLEKEEENFINYWSVQRLKKNQYLRKLSLGLPLAVLIVSALMINFLSGWYREADRIIRSNSSVIIVVLIAIIAIVIFITIFSARHKWDLNELRYQELLKRKEDAEMQQLSNK